MTAADQLRRVARGGRRRLGGSVAGRAAQEALARRAARRLGEDDPTLAALARALTAPAPGEDAWADRVEAVRAEYEAARDRITYVFDTPESAQWARDYVAGYTGPNPPVLVGDDRIERPLGDVTRSTSRSAEWGRLFYRLVRNLGPRTCVELGTSVGMSGCYLAGGLRANGDGLLVTIDAQESPVAFARRAFERLGVSDHVKTQVGTFEDRLPALLERLGTVDLAFIDGHHTHEPTVRYFELLAAVARPGTLLVFDDITPAHPGMEAAWSEIRADPRVTGALKVDTVAFAVVGGTPVPYRELARLPVR